jgi:hypothetical protein
MADPVSRLFAYYPANPEYSNPRGQNRPAIGGVSHSGNVAMLPGTILSVEAATATFSHDNDPSIIQVVEWFNGPDESSGYVIAYESNTTRSGRRTSGTASRYSIGPPPMLALTNKVVYGVGFRRTSDRTDVAFLALANSLAPAENFVSTSVAANWLNTNGYATTYTVPSLAGSLVFNGSNQSLSLSPGITFGAGAFTLEGWFYNNSSFTNKGIVGVFPTDVTGGLSLYFADNTTITSDKNGGGGAYSYTMGSAISLNAWHYLIYNRNSGGVTAVYIDGVRCTATVNDTYNYTGTTNTIGRYYNGYWPGYWTNMRITIGTAVYDSSQSTQTNPTAPLTSLANTKYLMLGAAVTTDTSGVQTVTNNNTVTQSSSLKPF